MYGNFNWGLSCPTPSIKSSGGRPVIHLKQINLLCLFLFEESNAILALFIIGMLPSWGLKGIQKRYWELRDGAPGYAQHRWFLVGMRLWIVVRGDGCCHHHLWECGNILGPLTTPENWKYCHVIFPISILEGFIGWDWGFSFPSFGCQ